VHWLTNILHRLNRPLVRGGFAFLDKVRHQIFIGSILFWTSLPSWAGSIVLELPVACKLGTECFIQNFVDHDPGSNFKDYHCGFLSYDGHRGTDFRVVDEMAMARGVPVVAAAPGVVLAVRDGEPDIPVSQRGQSNLAGKDAGNGVVIDHGDGWQTQYSHLRKGSVIVRKGEQVHTGQTLGMIGESGNAEFPHVDFSVRLQGRSIDPFQPDSAARCVTAMPPDALWSENAKAELNYIPTAFLQVGFADHVPNRLEAQTGRLSEWRLSREASALVLWTQVMGGRDGDRVHFDIQGPNGKLLLSSEQMIRGNKAVWVAGVGKRRAIDGWSSGRYSGNVRLMRQGKIIMEKMITMNLP
jgi:Peptidase family M23